ncbi:MAG: hypothetical protein ACOY3P_14645 [Planctomycetota bacterium]
MPIHQFVCRSTAGVPANRTEFARSGVALALAALLVATPATADEPEAINPFGARPTEREDAISGYVEMSDGSAIAGNIYLTRDKRLQLWDAAMKRQREVPLSAISQVECKVKKEWMEKEWKFKELALDEKMYTGREYPSREYMHVITLKDGRTIEGDLSAVVYVQPPTYEVRGPSEYRPQVEPARVLLHKRDKGEIGTPLASLRYVKLIKLGDEAFQEGQAKAKQKPLAAKP